VANIIDFLEPNAEQDSKVDEEKNRISSDHGNVLIKYLIYLMGSQ
jgi:hypothetical protein